jgi:REP element-mobilizing transposase RayT/DNA-binding response OmpR family regulator
MAPKILIATSIRSLGELIQQALQETGDYQAELVDSGKQALEIAPKKKFALAIVDFGSIIDPAEIVRQLRETISGLHIVAMPFMDDPQPSDVETELVDAWLSMPFYLPNLFETLEEIIDETQVESDTPANAEQSPSHAVAPKKNATIQPAPEWLQDVNRVAQHLTRLSLESTAQAALITRGNQLWAYAGQLPQNAAEELARSVGHIWAHDDGGNDLARFIRLDAVNRDYMLYATSLGGDYVLAMAFETEMSFTEMRVHAGDLAQKLSHPPETGPQRIQTSTEVVPVSNPPTSEDAYEDLPQIPSDWRPDQDVAEGRQAFFEELLTSMDIPNPDGITDSTEVAIEDSSETIIDDAIKAGIEAVEQIAINDKTNQNVADDIVIDKAIEAGIEAINQTQISDEISIDQDIETDNLIDIEDEFRQDINDEIATDQGIETDNLIKNTEDENMIDKAIEAGIEAIKQTQIDDHVHQNIDDEIAIDEGSETDHPIDIEEEIRENTADEIEIDEGIEPSIEDMQPVDIDDEIYKGTKDAYETEDDANESAGDVIDEEMPPFPLPDIAIPADYNWQEFNESALEMHNQEDTTPVPISPIQFDEPEIPPESLAETRPTAVDETVIIQRPVTRLPSGELEYSHQGFHKLTYACVLVPRLPRHHLVGDIATLLNQWAEEISLSYGWRLEHLAIRPDYLHWIAVLPPNSSPGLMVHDMQQETSQRIFVEFPRLERENPSGEFWASGYLIVNGRDPFSRDMVHEFIDNVRAHQGAQ